MTPERIALLESLAKAVAAADDAWVELPHAVVLALNLLRNYDHKERNRA